MKTVRLNKNETVLIIIDVQERLFNVMQTNERLKQNCIKLIKGCNLLNIPVILCEQYPKGLGSTIEAIVKELYKHKYFEKLSFSAGKVEELKLYIKELGVRQILLCGIETHVCVLQTALDLLEQEYEVLVVSDAVSSRNQIDYEIALQRMKQNGAQMTTVEMTLFEFLESAEAEEFKDISKILK